MNRQELFHGDFHLTTVSRRAGIRGASITFPPLCHTQEFDTNTPGRDIFTYYARQGYIIPVKGITLFDL